MRRRLLDLYCGAGGASVGYARAGFEVTGIDVAAQLNYPFRFLRADALETDPEWMAGFDLIHASPPCQHFTRYRNVHKDITERYEDLIAPTLELLERSGRPFVVENVPGAPIRADVQLCGTAFGLDVRRHRWFQLGRLPALLSPPCDHGTPKTRGRRFKSSSTRANQRFTIEVGAWDEPLSRQKAAMGVDWEITLRELSEAIPPAYTQWMASYLIPSLEPV